MVEHRFHLKPLFPLISGDGAFYLLALSQNQVRLFQGSRYHISEVILGEEVPLNGGTVYVVKPGEVPGGDLSAAVLRY